MTNILRIHIRKLIKLLSRNLGYELIKVSKLDKLLISSNTDDTLKRWTSSKVNPNLNYFVLHNFARHGTRAQLQQDLVALYVSLNNKHSSKYFVEIGAYDGVIYSNSYTLEKHFGFKGILCEPLKSCQQSLKQNRTAKIDSRCTWSESGLVLDFSERSSREYSGLSLLGDMSVASENSEFSCYEVDTVSLMDLLQCHNAPRNISYLSIDTEGSEWEIIKNFNFYKYEFDFISIEHNFRSDGDLIDKKLSSNGYTKVLADVSDFDYWYIRSNLVHILEI